MLNFCLLQAFNYSSADPDIGVFRKLLKTHLFNLASCSACNSRTANAMNDDEDDDDYDDDATIFVVF